MGLAAELQALNVLPYNTSSSSGGMPSWVPAVIAVPVALAVVAATAAAFLALRRRRRRHQEAAGAAPAGATSAAEEERVPLTPRSGKMDRMESGELKSSLQFDAVAGADVAASPAGPAGPASPMLSRASSTNHGSGSRLSDGSLLPAGASPAPHQTTASKLWRARCGFCCEVRKPCPIMLRHQPPTQVAYLLSPHTGCQPALPAGSQE